MKSALFFIFAIGLFTNISAQNRAGFLGKKNSFEIGLNRSGYFSVQKAFEYQHQANEYYKPITTSWTPFASYSRTIGQNVSANISYFPILERNYKFDWYPLGFQQHKFSEFYGVLNRVSHCVGISISIFNRTRGFYAPFGTYWTLGADYERWSNRIDQFTWGRIEDVGSGVMVYKVDHYPKMKKTNEKMRIAVGFGRKFIIGNRGFVNLGLTWNSFLKVIGMDEYAVFSPGNIAWRSSGQQENTEEFYSNYSKFSMEYTRFKLSASYGIFF